MELFNIEALAGVGLFITVLVNIAKKFGWIENGEAAANTWQLVGAIALTGIGWIFPDLLNADFLGMFDNAAAALAELGGFVIPVYLVMVKLGNIYHDVLARIPIVRDWFGTRLTE